MPGLPELIVVAFLVLLFFGHKLPMFGRSLGASVREFKDGLAEGEEEAESLDDQADAAQPEAQPKALGYTPEESR